MTRMMVLQMEVMIEEVVEDGEEEEGEEEWEAEEEEEVVEEAPGLQAEMIKEILWMMEAVVKEVGSLNR